MSKRLRTRKIMLEKEKKAKKTKLVIGIVCLIIVLVSGAAWLYVESQKLPEIKSNTSLFSTYEFSMRDIDGTLFSLNDYRGNVIVLHLMAVGCSGQINQINDNQLIRLKTLCNSYCNSEPVTIVSVAVATCENSRLSWLRDVYGISWFFGNDVDDGTVDIAQNYGVYGDGTIIVIDEDLQVNEAYSDVPVSTLKSKINQLLEA